jgi:ketosteroid isomerase-like protein
MSKNLDLVRSIYVDWERGDFSSTEWVDPEIEYVYADGPEPGRWTGLADMAEAWRVRLSAWEDFCFVMEDCREIDDERVLVLVGARGHFKTSGLSVDEVAGGRLAAHVFHVRDGKVVRLVAYWDRERALADLGLNG